MEGRIDGVFNKLVRLESLIRLKIKKYKWHGNSIIGNNSQMLHLDLLKGKIVVNWK